MDRTKYDRSRVVDVGQTNMDPKLISDIVSNIGLPGAILIYLIWRFDKFLTALTKRLLVFNHELKDIGYALNGIVEELKQIKTNVTIKPKN